MDLSLVLATLLVFGYMVVQTEPSFSSFWLNDQALGHRAGVEQPLDFYMALAGLSLILEATRRTIGWTLPLLALTFVAYAAFGYLLPDWLFPHRGYSWQRIVSQTFLHSQGVFGVALKVMFTYVFLFVMFGALLERTGATGFIIDLARKFFGKGAGGPAKVAILSSGLMGSLSGSAVANTATTGTFTIPMMKSSGFKPEIAAAVEAAASSGGALVPPVMGAGAYMMLEIIEPQVTYLQIIRAAIIPAILYYLALLLIVHFRGREIGAIVAQEGDTKNVTFWRGVVFLGAFLVLILFLLIGWTPFKAVSLTLPVIIFLALWDKDIRVGPGSVIKASASAAKSGLPLIAAASCVGIIVGVVTLTGIGSKLPGVLLPLAQNSLFLALLLLMVSTIILGMGLPSAVCYLLMATLVGPVLGRMGVVPLAAHLFIFYFGMMSMVTPPVALAAYTAATIADADIMKTGLAAFRFALVGFALPFAFVIRPQLLLLNPDSSAASLAQVFLPLLMATLATIPLAFSVSVFALALWRRLLLLAFALFLMLGPLQGHWLLGQLTALLGSAGLMWLHLKKE